MKTLVFFFTKQRQDPTDPRHHAVWVGRKRVGYIRVSESSETPEDAATGACYQDKDEILLNAVEIES
jgi:hypothetical protein